MEQPKVKYIARRRFRTGEGEKFEGDEVPEAIDFRPVVLNSMLETGMLEAVPVEETAPQPKPETETPVSDTSDSDSGSKSAGTERSEEESVTPEQVPAASEVQEEEEPEAPDPG